MPVLAATAYLSIERSPNPDRVSIKGVPLVVLIMVVLLVGLTFVLTRTAFGSHVYAVGGNAEAARRAGINVPPGEARLLRHRRDARRGRRDHAGQPQQLDLTHRPVARTRCCTPSARP